MKQNKLTMTPAALAALLDNDSANFLAAATPGGIEAQEKRGQLEQEQKQTLPRDLRGDREHFEKLGFVFGDVADDLFVNVAFPKGWKKVATGHSMWSDVLDDKGRKRGSIFYKAAFYDRRAHAYLSTRFFVDQTYDDNVREVFVNDAMGIVEKRITGLAAPDWEGNPTEADRCVQAIDSARFELKAWLTENFPNWKSPTMHWD